MIKHLPKFIVIFFLLLNLLGVSARVYVVTKLSTRGNEIKGMEIKLSSLLKENEGLKEKIAYLSSLSRVRDEAKAYGMVSPQVPEFLLPAPSASLDLKPGNTF